MQAAAQGDASETLRFNLALSHYKLGDYPAAQRAFESLRSSPSLAAVAEYHLGLVAAQTGQLQQATAHLRATQAMSDSIELRQLAELALQRLNPGAAPSKLSAAATLGGGFDSNRTQSSDRAIDGVPVADIEADAGFTELFAAARYRSDRANPVLRGSELRGGLYRRDYTTDHELDQTSAQLSLRNGGRLSAWQWGVAVETDAVWLGGDHFQDAAGLNLEATRSGDASSFTLRYRPNRIIGGDGYTYLSGWSQRAEMIYAYTASSWQLRLQYEAEFNDRRDLQLGSEFFSQSPIRQGLVAGLRHRPTPALSLDWSARYRYSRYADANRFFSSAGFVEKTRVDELLQAGVTAALALSRTWGLRLDYRYSDNRSGIDRYDYDRHVVLLGIDWSY